MTRPRRKGPLGWVGMAGSRRREIVGMEASVRAEAPVDPLARARTVRRALADAGAKAVEVDRLISTTAARRADGDEFARTALGPHGETVEVEVVPLAGVLEAAVSGASNALLVALIETDAVMLAFCLRSDDRGQSSVK